VFLLAVFGMIGTAATEPVFPAIMKYLLDQGFKAENQKLMWVIPLGVVGLFVFRAIFSFVTSYLMTWIAHRIVTDLRHQMFSKLLYLKTQTYHDLSPAKLGSRLLFEVGNVSEAVTNVLVTAIRESLTAIALLLYLFFLDWQLTLIALAVGPAIGWLIWGFGRRMRLASRLSIEAFRVMAHTIEETINAWNEIKSETGFCEKYLYVDWDFAKFLNNNPLFLQLMSIYNVASPMLSLCLPIFVLIVPFFVM
jgi:subfamily B ATP-binding cassette protein MsbA